MRSSQADQGASRQALATSHVPELRSPHQHEVHRPSCSKCGATWVDDQIGQEETPEQYVARLVEVFREVRRVLRDDGTLWLNLGDTHNNRARIRKSSHQPSLHAFAEATWKDTAAKGGCRSSINSGGIKEKDLLLIPAMVAMALRADGWYLRSDIIWHKASHLPESVRDRPTACHEHVFLLSKSKTYYYDCESIAEDCASSSEFSDKKNARDVWVIAPKPCTLAHFAVMPLDLAERCVKAGSSRVRVLLRLRSAVATTTEGLGAVLQVQRRPNTKQGARPICRSRHHRSCCATSWPRCGAHRVKF